MNRRVFLTIVSLIFALESFSIGVYDLTTAMQASPLAVDGANVCFGWKLSSKTNDNFQSAYQIVVSDNGETLWNSGKTRSGQSQLVKYSGKSLAPGKRYAWSITVWDKDGNTGESHSTFDTAPTFAPADITWIGAIGRAEANLPTGRRDFHGPSFKNEENRQIYERIAPLALRSVNLRKSFTPSKHIARAMVYVSGLGQYTLTLNGKNVSDDILTPAWSDYDKTLYYNTYSVESLLTLGENVIGVTLGNGFYNAVGNRYRKLWVSFGPPTLFFKMYLYYDDGTTETISSDKSWKYNLGPITFNDIYGGEDYDARLEQQGWNVPRFNDSGWENVVVQEAPKGVLRAQQLTNVRKMEEFGAQSMTRVDSGYVVDMGQNLSGYPAIKVSGRSGQTIRLTVGETLDSRGNVSQKQSGGPHTYSYTLKGVGTETWHPQFTYYGFRYIRVDGADMISSNGERPLVIDLKSHFIYNSTPQVGEFESSNEIFNKAHILIKNAVKSNMQSVFTDCPHREKLAWLEETHLNGPGLLYNWDLTQFYPKIMQDMADAQQSNGLIPNIAPEYVEFKDNSGSAFRDSPEWGVAVVAVPWLYYRFYGDNSLIVDYYDVMKRYVDYLTSRSSGHIVSHGLGDWYDYGDHRAGFSVNSPIAVSATSHYYYAVDLLAKAAKMAGRTKDEKTYTALAANIRKAFNDKFFDPATNQYGTGSQFCNAVAIFMNIVEPQNRAAVMANLKADIAKHGNRLTTGDVGNRYLFQALALGGENELMYLMHNHTDAPGYGFQVQFGATTLTEQWDPRRGASWNHFMMGQIDEWFFASLAGIVPSESGFKEFTIKPCIVGDLDKVKARHQTLYGDIAVEWSRADGVFNLDVEIPVNTRATIILPDGTQKSAGSGFHHFQCKY